MNQIEYGCGECGNEEELEEGKAAMCRISYRKFEQSRALQLYSI